MRDTWSVLNGEVLHEALCGEWWEDSSQAASIYAVTRWLGHCSQRDPVGRVGKEPSKRGNSCWGPHVWEATRDA